MPGHRLLAVALLPTLLLFAGGCGRRDETPVPVAEQAAPAPRAEAQPAPEPPKAAPVDASNWDFARFSAAMDASGRKSKIDETAFAAIRGKREKALAEAETYLKERFGEADPRVMQAFRDLPREYFHYNYQGPYAFPREAYEIPAKPWAVGYGSALSDYLGQLYMTQVSEPKPDQTVLEIGTGSGYQIALLSRLVRSAYSIEIIQPLGEGVARIFEPLGYDNVHTRVGDGYFGWPEVDGGFDLIIVTCAAPFVPPELLRQLKPGGKLVIPIGQPFKRGQFLNIYTKDTDGKVRSKRDMGVYFIPMTGAVEKKG
jgi:protein-L-isoaspartate(D-aspartate) O-methyltransferase